MERSAAALVGMTDEQHEDGEAVAINWSRSTFLQETGQVAALPRAQRQATLSGVVGRHNDTAVDSESKTADLSMYPRW